MALSAAMTAAAPAATKGADCACVPGKPTAASAHWNFKGETNQIFQQIRDEAQMASYHADKLASFAQDPNLDWTVHSEQLAYLRSEINDMGKKVCRLAQIRSADAPWQQTEIKRIHKYLQFMADSTDDAILFGKTHTNALWMPVYQRYTDVIFNQAEKLSHSVDQAVEYAGTSKEYKTLGQDLGVKKSS
ncbi:MAG: hypothetical protein KGN36_07890 [Acidobacteriota bacterium]|nr:hypothetical protein [Acidobacteriota bacterium]